MCLKSNGSSVFTSEVVVNVLKETFVHKRCESNVIVYESVPSFLSLRISEDKAAIIDLLAVNKNSILSGIKLAWLGRANINITRPFKIMFNIKIEALYRLAAYSEEICSGVVFPDGFCIGIKLPFKGNFGAMTLRN